VSKQAADKNWLQERLLQLITFPVSHEKAVILQKRNVKHQHEGSCF